MIDTRLERSSAELCFSEAGLRLQLLDCVGRGGTSLSYRARSGTGHIYVLKEYFPAEFCDRITRDPSTGQLCPIEGLSESELELLREQYRTSFQGQKAVSEQIRYSNNNNEILFLSGGTILRLDDEWNVFLLTETLAGVALDQLPIRTEGRDRVVECLNITVQILRAVKRLHEYGYLHLDIKPQNMWCLDIEADIAERPIALLDFGSCCEVGEADGQMSFYSFSRGFSAPNYINAARGYDHTPISERCDLYSVGKCLEWLLCEERAASASFSYLDSDCVAALTSREEDALIRFLKRSENMDFPSADSMIDALTELRCIVLRQGIHPDIFRAIAEEKAEKFRREIDMEHPSQARAIPKTHS